MEGQQNVWLALFLGILPVLGLSAAMMVATVFGMMIWVRMGVKNRIYCLYFEKNRHIEGELLPLPAGDSQQMITGRDHKMYVVDPDRQYWMMYPPGLPGFVQEPVPCQVFNREDSIPLGTSRNANSDIKTFLEDQLSGLEFEPEHRAEVEEYLEKCLAEVTLAGRAAPRSWLVAAIRSYQNIEAQDTITVDVSLNGNSGQAIRAIDPLHRETIANAQVMQNIQDTAFMQAAIKMASEHLGEGGNDYSKWSLYLLIAIAAGLGAVGWMVFDMSSKLGNFISVIGSGL